MIASSTNTNIPQSRCSNILVVLDILLKLREERERKERREKKR